MEKNKDYELNLIAMQKWNEKRAEAEKKGIENFWQMYNSPVLHPSKFLTTKTTKQNETE
jgi:hypothetical protein